MANAFRKALWIWQGSQAHPDEFCDFLTRFDGEAGKSYTLSIAADSNYTVWINGQLAAFGQYADFPHYKVYDKVDITEFVKAGENRLVVTAWYVGVGTSTYAVGEAGLIFEVGDADGNVVAYSCEETLSRLSRDYISHRADLISGQLGPTYHYDVRGYDGYIEAGCNGFEKSRAVPSISTDFHIRPNKKLTLEPRSAVNVCQCGVFTYGSRYAGRYSQVNMQLADLGFRHFGELAPGGSRSFDVPTRFVKHETDAAATGIYFIVDLGAESVGFLDIDLEVPHDCRIDVGFGEHLEDGRLRTASRAFFCDIEAKQGRNTYLHTFRRFGCRYLQFFVHASEVTVHYAGLRQTLYPLVHKAYKSGNLLRDTIYKVCQNTLQQCLHEHYEDCPWREQALYCLDSRNQMLCGYYAFNEFEAPRAALELIAQGQRADGLMRLCSPASGFDAPIPAFSCAYLIEMDEYIRYSGDTTLAETYYDRLEKVIAAFMARMQPEGIIENFYGAGQWCFYEWSYTMEGTIGETQRRLEAPLNAFFSLALGSMASICDALGKSDRAEEYRAIRRKLNEAVGRIFYNPETKMFESFDIICRGEYAVLTQALCVLCGAGEGLDLSVILPILASNGKDRQGLATVVPNTLSMNSFRFDALLAIDRETYGPVILDEIDRDYLYMLRRGATTFWETIRGAEDFDGAGSLCHGWSALPVYYYELLN